MPKNLLQDMVREKRARLGVREEQSYQKEEKEREIIEKRTEKTRNVGRGGRRSRLWIVAIVAVLFLFFALSYLFGKATITINPKVKSIPLTETLSASKGATDDDLSFDLVVISGEEDESIPTGEVKDVAQPARGVVVIYNAYSTASQRLDINTRLEGSNGKMYKTEKAVTVPGMKGTTPGSVEVNAYGAETGADYNSAPLDFKIFGFKGTPKYAKFYARSKAPMTGGLKGKFPFISDDNKAKALVTLKNGLQDKLFKKITDQIPAGFIMFKDGVFLDSDAGSFDFNSAQGQSVPAKMTGTLYGLLFDETKLTKKIAQDKLPGYDGSDVFIPGMKDLAFSLLSKDATSFTDVKNINFSLSGHIKIVSKIDTAQLTTDLLGHSKSDFNQIMLRYPNVDSAESVINPFWKFSFPDKAKDIKIVVNYPQ